jgi:HD-GYP domain-containing protein (c-di-GMP phosphodiesterase class II)
MSTAIHHEQDLDPARQKESPWQILERLVQELQAHSQIPQQVRSTLEAVRESTRADVVCWYAPAGHGQAIALGDSRLSSDACQRFVADRVAQAGSGKSQFVWSNPDGHADAHATPCSAALLRVGSANSAWLAAVSLNAEHHFHASDLELLSLARRLLISQNQQGKANARWKDSLLGLIRCLTVTLDARDAYTAGHSERVARIAKLVGQHMELPSTTVNGLFLAGLLHDIGKIGVPDAVLQKPGRLTRKEFSLVQDHVTIGDRILSSIKPLEQLRPGIRHHHERFDGKGYPDGLAGEAIPLLARVLSVADSCDAMMSARRYRPALSPPQIDALFQEGAGKQWDPLVVEHFMACRQEIYPPIYQKGLGDSAKHAVAELTEGHGEGSSMFFKVFAPDADEESTHSV